MRTITNTAVAFLSQHSSLDKDGLPSHVSNLTFASERGPYWEENGYTYVGTAEITVHMVEKQELIENKVQALRNEVIVIKAKSTMECTKIESQIQDLLSIGFSAIDDSIPF